MRELVREAENPGIHPIFCYRDAGGEAEEVAQESFPDDLDQSPALDPTEPEPIPEDDLDQTRGA